MGIARAPERVRNALLVIAVALSFGGLVSTGVVGGTPAGEVVSPSRDGRNTTSLFGPAAGVDTTLGRRSLATWLRSKRARATPPTRLAVPPPVGAPRVPPRPGAQVGVAVPAAGAHASVGQGEGSCTTVGLTALAPEGCPAPSGDGPVVVAYQGPDPAPPPKAAWPQLAA